MMGLAFICEPCKSGADITATDVLKMRAKKDWHDKCLGSTRCDCQHKVKK